MANVMGVVKERYGSLKENKAKSQCKCWLKSKIALKMEHASSQCSGVQNEGSVCPEMKDKISCFSAS
jgi:hypothetical protein